MVEDVCGEAVAFGEVKGVRGVQVQVLETQARPH